MSVYATAAKGIRACSLDAHHDLPHGGLQSITWCRHLNLQVCGHRLHAPCFLEITAQGQLQRSRMHSWKAFACNLKSWDFGSRSLPCSPRRGSCGFPVHQWVETETAAYAMQTTCAWLQEHHTGHEDPASDCSMPCDVTPGAADSTTLVLLRYSQAGKGSSR